MTWDPDQYLRFRDDRARPFVDLVARIGAREPAAVVDLGCGPGTLTATLAQRWPSARIIGVDSSPEMIAAAAPLVSPNLAFEVGDAISWQPSGPVDVVVTNALLQWVPDHEPLLARVAAWLAPDGWLALQVPGNFTAPSHLAIAELCVAPRWHDRLGDLAERSSRPPVLDPAGYADVLADAGLAADTWETTYLHLLAGDDAVLEWVRGTALRPALDRLTPDEATELCAELATRLRAAYPPSPHGTPFPFRRVFAVGHRIG